MESDLSDLTLSMRRVTGSSWIADFPSLQASWCWPKGAQPLRTRKLECTHEHAHSKILVEPTWQNEHGNHHFGGHVGFVFEEDSGRQVTWLSWRHRFRKAPFSKCFPSTLNRKALFSNSSVLRAFSKSSVFGGQFPWRNKAPFSNSSGVMWTGP